MPDGTVADNYIAKTTYYTVKTVVTIKGADGKEAQTTIFPSDYKNSMDILRPI
jgi:hypothetical protein